MSAWLVINLIFKIYCMIKLFATLRNFMLFISFVFLGTACSLEKDNNNYDYGKLSAISLINTVPQANPLEVFIDQLKITKTSPAFGFGEFLAYHNVYPGERSVSIFKASQGDAAFAGNFLFEAGKIYSLFIAGDKNNLAVVQIEDQVLVPEKGFCTIRFVHMVKNMKPQQLLLNNKSIGKAVAYKEATLFVRVAANTSINLSVSGSKVIKHVFKPNDQGVYTILLQGEVDAEEFSPALSVLEY